MRVYMCVCVRIRAQLRAHVSVRVRVCVCAYVCVCTSVRVCARASECVCVQTLSTARYTQLRTCPCPPNPPTSTLRAKRGSVDRVALVLSVSGIRIHRRAHRRVESSRTLIQGRICVCTIYDGRGRDYSILLLLDIRVMGHDSIRDMRSVQVFGGWGSQS